MMHVKILNVLALWRYATYDVGRINALLLRCSDQCSPFFNRPNSLCRLSKNPDFEERADHA
jgi:hypothetical protein